MLPCRSVPNEKHPWVVVRFPMKSNGFLCYFTQCETHCNDWGLEEGNGGAERNTLCVQAHPTENPCCHWDLKQGIEVQKQTLSLFSLPQPKPL